MDSVMFHTTLDIALQAIHSLSAAAWFGALVYRTFFVDPKAKHYFGGDAEYERYSLNLADGTRYVVMLALLTCGISGFVLMGMRWEGSASWLGMMTAKIAVWLIASTLFAYISWVYWPRRVFATAAEWSTLRRQGVAICLVMIALAGIGFLLGQVGQMIRLAA
jgi:uncharacterized membrane protein